MSIHVCKCERNGRPEYHLRYPGMTEAEAQNLADKINAGALTPSPEPREPAQPGVACGHDWAIWPETDGLEQRCRKCGEYRPTPPEDQFWKRANSPAQPAPEQGEAVAPHPERAKWFGTPHSTFNEADKAWFDEAAPQPAPEKAEAPKYLYPEASAVPFDYVMTILREAGDHLGRVMEDHPYCDHVHVVKAFGDVWRKTHGYVPRPTHPEQKAEAAVPAGLVSDLSLLVMRMARRLSITDVGSVHVVGNKNLAQQATDYLRRKGLTSPLREDATPSPVGTTPTEGQA